MGVSFPVGDSLLSFVKIKVRYYLNTQNFLKFTPNIKCMNMHV